MKGFMVYQSHDAARCFNCGGRLPTGLHKDSGYPVGRGRYQNQCEGCDVWTWYDLAEEVSC